MSNEYTQTKFFSESDVEQKFIYKLLIKDEPDGFGYSDSDIRTKTDIRKLLINKGAKKKLYYPDYAIIVDGLPSLIIEAKAPGEDVLDAVREARLYATEINSCYSRNINPCERIIVTDGNTIVAGFWDEDNPNITINVEDFDIFNPIYIKLIEFASKKTITNNAQEILKSIKSKARYFKPIYMLGGKSVINETVGENTFGANVSIEYKYLFNPDSIEDREAIIHNAYVNSKRKQSHVTPIDKIIRAAIPKHIIDAREIDETRKPKEIIEQLNSHKKIKNELCILIGSVGSGKSTFADYLRMAALPDLARTSTVWINLNLNKAPLNRELIYNWVVDQSIIAIKNNHPKIDFDHIDTLKKIYAVQLDRVDRGRASLYPRDSEKYIDIIFSEIEKLQNNNVETLEGIINYLYSSDNKLLVIIFDNCDKRNRDDQLLMFDVASWLKNTVSCMIFLPIRDTTFDQYRNEPPLDTVIKDLVFRIDPPLLEKVIYSRLNYALREIDSQCDNFVYFLANNMRVKCSRNEVAIYLKSIVTSLFQDNMFKRIIVGLAGRNIRKGLEILLDFCKSGHISEDVILKVRQSNGEYLIPNHLIAKILLKGKRKYYSDDESHIKNLFSSDNNDPLPNPFVRSEILQWLKNRFSEYGPNRTKGFHKVGDLLRDLQASGNQSKRILIEVSSLVKAGCINSEAQNYDLCMDDLISIAPPGFIHLDLLTNINYLSSVAEDTFFRENQVAKGIADNLIGRGKFHTDSRQSAISNSKLLIDYMTSYYKEYFLGSAKILSDDNQNIFSNVFEIKRIVDNLAENDAYIANYNHFEKEYPPGSQIEAQIVSIQNYGIFVEFGLSGAGLIHKSKFSIDNTNVLDSYESGDWVIVEIIKYNQNHNRFDLRLIDA